MTKAHCDKKPPFLFLDEFNQGEKRDLSDMDRFMRVCQTMGFYLIIITSKEEVADSLIDLNAWSKMRPLQAVHHGPTSNIPGQPGYEENKKPKWKSLKWTPDQLQKVVIIHKGELDSYDFIVNGMTPTDALAAAGQYETRQESGEAD
jgi:hypothetical protein